MGRTVSRGILDTSILIATDVTPIPGELAISVASLAELQFGVLVAKTAEARALRLARFNAGSTRAPSTKPSLTATHGWRQASSRPAAGRGRE